MNHDFVSRAENELKVIFRPSEKIMCEETDWFWLA